MTPYNQDGLRSHHNYDFMNEPAFQRAYARGMQAVGADYHLHWPVHIGLWAAACAIRLEGDFVECGVGRGFMSSAIMTMLDWNATGRTFYLLDTFSGMDPRYLSARDREAGVEEQGREFLENGFYTADVQEVRRNFAEWPSATIVEGAIPETLCEVKTEKIAFLHLDLNCSLPELAALEAFWERLLPGAPVLLADYAYIGYESQKAGMDEFAAARAIPVLSLPTGQGLILKAA